MIEPMFHITYQSLVKCAIRREYLHVDRYLRGIGKTSAIIAFAKDHDLYVVVSYGDVRSMWADYNYDKIINKHHLGNLRGRDNVELVFDEGVELERLTDFKVITGIISDY